MNKILTRVLLLLFFVLPLTQDVWAQREVKVNTVSVEMEAATQETPLEFRYQDTPGIAYGRFGRNPFTNYSDEQVAVLATYNYPKFISHGKEYLEIDIKTFKEARKDWEDNHAQQMNEIYQKIGVRNNPNQ